jgi:hypothetical protein
VLFDLFVFEGVTFHGTSLVNVGSLVATTATNVVLEDGRYHFTGGDQAKIINHGNISISEGGFAVLVAPYVENTGVIQASLGQIGLASADQFTVDFRGDGLIKYTVSGDLIESDIGVSSSGTLRAPSGVVNLSSQLASSVVGGVVNLEGVVDVDSFGGQQDAGSINIDSSGDINFHDVTVSADGGLEGDGGRIYSFADGKNDLGREARLTARGGSQGGDGGFIEQSGNDIRND